MVECFRPWAIVSAKVLMAASELFLLSVGEPKGDFKENDEESGCSRYL